MDLEARRKLGGLIDKATSTGHLSLEPQPLRQIKAIAKKSDENVKSAFHFLSQKLKADSSEVRYLALLLVNEFFTRSACFRALLIDEFQNFLELVVGTKVYKPLPPPSERAVQLRQKGLEFIENWHEQYGHANKQLRVGHHYLKHSLRMRFPEVRLQSEIAERERRQREEQTQKILRVKFERVKKEIDEYVVEQLQPFLLEMDGCFDILMPRDFDAAAASASISVASAAARASSTEGKGKEKAIDDGDDGDEVGLEWEPVLGADEDEEEEEDDEEVDDVLRRHGIGSGGAYELNISFDKSFASMMDGDDGNDEGEEEQVLGASDATNTAAERRDGDAEVRKETNKPVVDCLRNDLRAVTRRYGPLVDEWYDVLLKVDFPLPGTDSPATDDELRDGEKRRERDRLLRQVIELRSAISAAVRKCGDLGITVAGEPKRPAAGLDAETAAAHQQTATTEEEKTSTRRESEAGEEDSEEMTTTTASSSTSPSHHHNKRTLAELFGESDDEENDREEEKRPKVDDDDEEDEEELEFEEVSMIADVDDDEVDVEALDEDQTDEAKAGDESMVADSPAPATRTRNLLTSSPSPVPPSPYSSSTVRTASSPAAGEAKKATTKKKKDDVKVRERLRRRLGVAAKRRPPVVKPQKLSTHRPLQL